LGAACDGLEALDAARAQRPDLYLFDIDMPHLDGLRAAATLADEGLRRPVVVLTGVEDPGLVERSIASGVSAYLTKPIDERQPTPRSASPQPATANCCSLRPKYNAPTNRSPTASSSNAPRAC
jgi:AmiR/NasT family two-component response regulator